MTVGIPRYPLYPTDRLLTVEQQETMARAARVYHDSHPMRVCKLDNVPADAILDSPPHTHTYEEFMAYRHAAVIGDQDPWTYWDYSENWIAYPHSPPEVVDQLIGWYPRARINYPGPMAMDGWSNEWVGFSFVTWIEPSKLITPGPGSKTLVTLFSSSLFGSLYIGPMSSTPWVASSLHQLTFNHQFEVLAGGEGGYQIFSDIMAFGLDGTHGIMVTGYVSGGPGWLAYRSHQEGWWAGYQLGDTAADLDKSGYTRSTKSSYALTEIQNFYP